MNISAGPIFDRVALACGAISMCIGGAGLAGWVIGSRILTGVRLDYIPMAPNSALIVILLGCALISGIVWSGNRTILIAIAGISSLCILIAGLTLIGIVTGIDLRIDHLLLNPTGTIGAVPVGHMSSITAICFLLGSAAILLLLFKKNNFVSLLGTGIALVGGVVIIGYWYGAPLLYGGTIVPVAFTTAVALGVLGIGLNAAAGPDTWPLSSVTGVSTRSRILRGLLPVILLLVLIVNWINVVIVGHPDSSVVLLSAVTAVLSLVIVYVVVSKTSGKIGDTIDQSERERKKAEEALRLTNTVLSSQMEVTIDGVLVVDETGKIISYNHRFIEIWGIPPDVIASRSDERALQSVLDNLVNPEEFLTRVKYLYMHREEKSHEEIRLNDNRMLDRYSAPMIGNDGRYYGRVWYFRDITDRKKAEQEIARIADEWEVTFNAASDGICLIDANQKLIRCNTRMGEILGGMKNEDLAGKPCWAVVHKTTGPIPECPFVSAKKTLTRTRVEVPAGDLWFEVTADPVIDSSGMFAGAVHIMRDITDRKRAEEALRESETRYRNLFKSSHDAMMTLEPPSWKFTTGNPATVQMFLARDEAEFTSREPWSLSPELQPDGRDSGDKAKEMIETAMRDGTNFFEWTHKRLNGEDFPATVLLSKVELAGKVFLQATVRDITEQKRAEEALRQANKQLNLLSSITRHDILNQLMALKGYLELSHEMIDNPTTLLGYIQKEEKAANTIEAQITFTKNYQALGVTAPVWQNVNASINKAIAGLPMRDVHVEVDPKNPDVFADPLFEKVFYNLIDNALRYGGDQMKTIRFSSQESDGRLIQVCEDDGVGISTEDKKKLFTRGFGKNTGLGLFLSREILAITGITIAENGIPGKGARFEITVPKGAYRFKGTGGN